MGALLLLPCWSHCRPTPCVTTYLSREGIGLRIYPPQPPSCCVPLLLGQSLRASHRHMLLRELPLPPLSPQQHAEASLPSLLPDNRSANRSESSPEDQPQSPLPPAPTAPSQPLRARWPARHEPRAMPLVRFRCRATSTGVLRPSVPWRTSRSTSRRTACRRRL